MPAFACLTFDQRDGLEDKEEKIHYFGTGSHIPLCFFRVIHIFGYCCRVRNINHDETAVEDYAQQVFQVLQLFAVYSTLVVLREKYFQLKNLKCNKNLNFLTYCVGLLGTLILPMIFIFDMKKFRSLHYGLTAIALMLSASYFWLLSFTTFYLLNTCRSSKSVVISHVMRLLTNLLSSMILVFQVGGMVFERFSECYKLTERGRFENHKIYVLATSYTEYIFVCSIMFNTLICIYDANISKNSNSEENILLTDFKMIVENSQEQDQMEKAFEVAVV
ncbi:hypothetical protein RF11_07635 [Thelohanellus kitauei]|uniref:CWH43-like N-terminal domain-containing protein n=1 Tax=Thelohanellus kitauei TaxID=669202 RepID=A0A0C2N6G9_THEKT|nr:hypothetical protein RF11_07635 [Thelohanellus kitauei]